jgi:hypothetical protein
VFRDSIGDDVLDTRPVRHNLVTEKHFHESLTVPPIRVKESSGATESCGR